MTKPPAPVLVRVRPCGMPSAKPVLIVHMLRVPRATQL
jgi:hypothetical protein